MATAKQIAWRKKFAEMARSGALKRKRAKKNPAPKKRVTPAPKRRAANPTPKKRSRSLADRIESDYFKVEKTPHLDSRWTLAGYFATESEAKRYAHYIRDRDNMYVRVRR